jgi:hypothetical protein
VERQLYKSRKGWQKKIVFHSWCGEENHSSYGKIQQAREKNFHMIRVEVLALDAAQEFG